jgi:putative tryptophan/tyrosine transport system substrate-binding protein
MRRREFITLLGSAVASWPLGVRAEQPEPTRRIGVLMNRAADDLEGQAATAAFRRSLEQLGRSNVQIDTRWGGGDVDRERRYADELIALAPDVILAAGSMSVMALQHVTRSLPIVFVGVGDPVGTGFVDALARPGGNTTGFMLFEYSLSVKWLELLKEIAPSMTRAAVLRNPANPASIAEFVAIRSAGQQLGVEVSPINVQVANEIERAVVAFAQSTNGGYAQRCPLHRATRLPAHEARGCRRQRVATPGKNAWLGRPVKAGTLRPTIARLRRCACGRSFPDVPSYARRGRH